MRAATLNALFVSVGLALALTGCGGKPDPIMAQLFGYQCQGGEGNPMCSTRAPGEGGAEVSRFCYGTIGDANCFDRPDPDRKNQALGSSGY